MAPMTAPAAVPMAPPVKARCCVGVRFAQPGKILHELRVGEMARLGKIPHMPYYGTIDATLLFLILLNDTRIGGWQNLAEPMR
jgi:hypothetical protein